MALLLTATIIGAFVYFLLLGNQAMTSSLTHDNDSHMQSKPHLSVDTSTRHVDTTFGEDDELMEQERTAINFLNHYNGINRHKYQSSAASTAVPLLASKGIDPSTPVTTARSISTQYVSSFDTTTMTTNSPSKYSKGIVYTSSLETRRRKMPNTKYEEKNFDRSKLLFPTKETLEIFGFTSGHQNNFGVPIEEDERILRMLNEEMLNSQRRPNKSQSTTFIVSTTDLNMYQTKVSPTLPILRKSDATTTERISSSNGTEDGKSEEVVFYS